MHKNGFTLVEAIIVVVILVVMMTVLVSNIRERERKKWEAERAALQAHVDEDPDEVFTMNCWPVKKSFASDEALEFTCEVSNPTLYPLDYAPKGFLLMTHKTADYAKRIELAVEDVEMANEKLALGEAAERYPGATVYQLAPNETLRFQLVSTGSISQPTRNDLESLAHSIWMLGFQESARSEPFTIGIDQDE